SIERFPDRRLFGTRKKHGWHYVSYREFGDMVAAARAGLAKLGIVPGQRVAVISDNRLEWAVGSFATFSLGAIYVPMYQAQLDRDYEHILKDSGAKLCFCANETIAARVRALAPALPELEHIIHFDSPEYAGLLESGRTAPTPSVMPQDKDVAIYIYTSGTTGEPKGVELTHYNLGATASAIIEISPLTEDGECSLAFLPWAHVFGGCIEVAVLIGYGGAIAICDSTDRLLDYLAEVKPTALFAVPRIWNRIYDGVVKQIDARPKPIQTLLRTGLRARGLAAKGKPINLLERVAMLATNKLLVAKIEARLGGRVRFAVSGAAALSAEVAEFIDNLGIVVLEGYGLTETTGGATASKPNERRLGAVGKPLPGYEIRLERGIAGAGPDEGEIIIHGSGVMRGYHNQPGATEQAFTSDGGFRTGDIGRFDSDGFLYITGRVKELYKLSNGKYIAPVALEEKLQLSPFIAQCCVYGTDKPHNTAVIIPDLAALQTWATANGVAPANSNGVDAHAQAEALLREPRVRALIRKELDQHSRDFKGYEQIRDFVLDDELFTTQNDMLTPSLKLKRRNVIAKYGPRLDALYVRAPLAAEA
ncbi:MAG TPA: long-chain fatty acid--CoA ligase, partial [Polyangiales bacterium]|nr:long-chain fatty acid--CoA ligase [Polyangiales bacterium]